VTRAFFPDTAFAWAFCVSLILLTGVAAWTDTRRAKIPNRLNLAILALGLAMNAIRVGWLAAESRPLWLFDTGSVWLGIIDGLLFAIAGFLVAFAAMFLVWMFNSCGGGDVKLFSAVAAWVGIGGFLFVWLGSVLVLFFWMAARILSGGMKPRQIKKSMAKIDAGRKAHGEGKEQVAKPGKIRMTYSLPLVVATVVVLLVVYRYELKLVPPKPVPEQPQGALAHARPSPSYA
jgi:Flp pilus assembly protein protease CpaA